MGQGACWDHAKSLYSHAGTALGIRWEPVRTRTVSAHNARILLATGLSSRVMWERTERATGIKLTDQSAAGLASGRFDVCVWECVSVCIRNVTQHNTFGIWYQYQWNSTIVNNSFDTIAEAEIPFSTQKWESCSHKNSQPAVVYRLLWACGGKKMHECIWTCELFFSSQIQFCECVNVLCTEISVACVKKVLSL